MTNLFICHRPYHYLFSAYIAKNHFCNNTINYCINFDVYTYSTNSNKVNYEDKNLKLTRYDEIIKKRSIFKKVYLFTRRNEVSIWHIKMFFNYYRNTVLEYSKFISNFNEINNVYFFSDKEKPIEILVLLLKRHFNPNIYLIDEGIVSCSYKSNNIKRMLKYLIVHLLNFKYIGDNYNYAQSNIYDYFVSTYGKIINIPLRKKKINIENINIDVIRPYLNIYIPKYTKMSILYISSPLSEDRYDYSLELSKIKMISEFWKKQGYEFIIKMHPLENNDKFISLRNISNVKVIDNKIFPVDLLFQDFEIITGLSSSALLNASNINGKVVICYNNIFNINDHITKMIMDMHGIYVIKELDDMINIIN